MTKASRLEPVLTRDLLREGGFLQLVAADAPGLRVLTDAERAASLAGLLATRPEPRGGGVWVFAYGSLIWNPAVHFVERRFARLHGWHRSFCLSVRAGRGSPEQPGLMLGLDRGGACAGAAFRIAEEVLEEELALLWRREMLAGSYVPRWVSVRDETGVPFAHAIAFTICRDGTSYIGKLPEAEVVQRLARARGPIGSAADYLFETRDGLRSLGIVDRRIERLATRVAAAVAADQAVNAK